MDERDAPELAADDLGEPVHVVDRVRRVLVDQLLEHVGAEGGVGAADHVDDAERVLAALDRRLVRPVHEGAHRDERVPSPSVVPDRVDPAGGRGDRRVGVHLRGELVDVARLENRVVVENRRCSRSDRARSNATIARPQRVRLAAARLALEHGRAGRRARPRPSRHPSRRTRRRRPPARSPTEPTSPIVSAPFLHAISTATLCLPAMPPPSFEFPPSAVPVRPPSTGDAALDRSSCCRSSCLAAVPRLSHQPKRSSL